MSKRCRQLPRLQQHGQELDPVPGLGAHTDAILGELGYAAADIANLRAAGAI